MKRLPLIAAILSTVAASWSPTRACLDFHPDALSNGVLPPDAPGSQVVLLQIDDLITHGDSAGNSCGLAVGPIGVGDFTSVKVIDRKGKAIPGFRFAASSTTADSIACVTGSGGHGFSGELDATVPDGIPASLVLTVELRRGETVDDLVRAIDGAPLTLGSTDHDGWFDAGHLSVRKLVIDRTPSLSRPR